MDDLKNPAYQPEHLIEVLIDKLDLKNASALAHALGLDHVRVSKIRHKKMPVSAGLLIVMGDAVGLTVGQLRNLMGLPSRMYITRYITR